MAASDVVTDTATSTAVTAVTHPLDALTAGEVAAAVSLVEADPRFPEGARFAHVKLDEPAKELVAAHAPGDPVERRLRALLVPGPDAHLIETVVSVTKGEVLNWTEVPDVRPSILFGEALDAILAVKAHPGWQEAVRARGIDDLENVQIDPWPAGSFGLALEDNRRIARCLAYHREEQTDNGYARPVEGLIAFVDLGRGKVLELEDHGAVPLPPEKGSYLAADVGPLRDDVKPLDIVQPEGPSFVVEGNLIRWQRWSLRVSMDPHEGLVLHTVGYEDGGRVRSVLHRASVDEMVVPYGDAGPMHGWKNAFDAGEWGLGRLANPLTQGCDCLGTIHYFDAVLADDKGAPYTLENAICLHEEDYGILWKHVDLHGDTTEVRRSRRLVVSFIATVGNYEYGFYWYFYQDASIQLEVKLTGVLQTKAVTDGAEAEHSVIVAPGLAAPHHQHLFNVRLDLDVDGTDNSVCEVDVDAVPPGDANPGANAFDTVVRRLDTEHGARRTADPARSRSWQVVNESVRNRLGQPVAYRLVPGATPTMLAAPQSSVAKRAAFATRNLWVTPFAPDERRAAGEYPNQHAGGDGLPRWTAGDRDLADTDVVLWYTFGITHVARPEDWPVMPVEYTGFLLQPVGFFDRNPALDVPLPNGHRD